MVRATRAKSRRAFAARGRNEDELAFLRDGGEFRNLLLVEQPNGDYADTMARQFYSTPGTCSLLQRADALDATRASPRSPPRRARKSRYHVERSADWVIRLGDGTDESHARMQAALDDLWMYTGEMFDVDAIEHALVDAGVAADVARAARAVARARSARCSPRRRWRVPAGDWMQGSGGRGGKQGVHTEHLGHLLAEMQFLQRAYPGAQW